MKLSIVCPTIRIKNLSKYYSSIVTACKQFTWEVIFISPYLLPEELLNKGNVRYIHSYADPTTCFNMGCSIARGEIIMNSTDDGLFQEDSLDFALEMMDAAGPEDLVNFVYAEGVLDDETLEELPASRNKSFQPDDYWLAGFHGALRLPGINPNWDLCLHFLIKRVYFEKLGYLDTRFTYVNMNLHILAFTAQMLGSTVHHLPFVGFRCSHLDGIKDHIAIEQAHNEELSIFVGDYINGAPLPKLLNKDAWKSRPAFWEKRFKLTIDGIQKL